jgi:hypothetical protein
MAFMIVSSIGPDPGDGGERHRAGKVPGTGRTGGEVAAAAKGLRQARRAGKLAPESRANPGMAAVSPMRGASMRIVFLTGILLALSGCAIQRDVTFIYYPNAPHKGTFPYASEFYAVAQKECALYGMNAAHYWDTYADFQRVKVIYSCIQ